MAMLCTVCSNQNQGEIDQMLLAGTSLRQIARQHGTSATALHRHKKHISKGLVVAREAAVVAKADTLLDQVRNLLSQAERLTLRAEQAGSLDTALRGIAQVRGVLELLGEVSGQLAGKGTQIAIGINAGGGPIKDLQTMSNEELKTYLLTHGHPLLEGNPPLLEGDTP
jgi:transposase-like protein